MKSHSALSKKFKPLYYDHIDVSGSCSSAYDHISLKHPSSLNMDEGNILGSLPFVDDAFPINPSSIDTNPLSIYKSLCDLQDRCRALERKLELANFPKTHPNKDKHQASFSPLENGENKHFTPLVDVKKLSEEEWSCLNVRMYFHEKQIFYSLKQDDVRHLICDKAKALVEEKQAFISVYLQNLHIYLSAIPSLKVLGLKLVKDMKFENSKMCKNLSEFLLRQQDNKQFCNCNRNFTINRACIDLQYYQPISLTFKNEVLTLTLELLLDYGLVHQLICSDLSQASNFGRKVNLGLIQGFKMNKKFVDAIIISKAHEWTSDGSILSSQHYISLHYQNRKPTLLSY